MPIGSHLLIEAARRKEGIEAPIKLYSSFPTYVGFFVGLIIGVIIYFTFFLPDTFGNPYYFYLIIIPALIGGLVGRYIDKKQHKTQEVRPNQNLSNHV